MDERSAINFFNDLGFGVITAKLRTWSLGVDSIMINCAPRLVTSVPDCPVMVYKETVYIYHRSVDNPWSTWGMSGGDLGGDKFLDLLVYRVYRILSDKYLT